MQLSGHTYVNIEVSHSKMCVCLHVCVYVLVRVASVGLQQDEKDSVLILPREERRGNKERREITKNTYKERRRNKERRGDERRGDKERRGEETRRGNKERKGNEERRVGG